MLQRLLPYTPERDVYRLLGVSATASSEEIVAACRRLARTFHPDRNGSERATEEMQVVNVVRQVMTDPQWRAIYDRERRRFHQASRMGAHAAGAGRPMPIRVPVPSPGPPAAPAHVTVPEPEVPAEAAIGPSPWGRYLRAAALGARAMLGGLVPSRCRSCRIVIEPGDAYCAACGTPLLTGG
ncbi:MAG TPA: J domain-containing protein [Candidatus Limnocylindria bacterium]|nr:J domain-containing protein [Candidatus Limnocylindria bacterium]